MNMKTITINEFADKYLAANKGEKRADVVKALKDALARKKNGKKCCMCGAPIWAAGCAFAGADMCFSCMTGEADSSEDYEITE